MSAAGELDLDIKRYRPKYMEQHDAIGCGGDIVGFVPEGTLVCTCRKGWHFIPPTLRPRPLPSRPQAETHYTFELHPDKAQEQ